MKMKTTISAIYLHLRPLQHREYASPICDISAVFILCFLHRSRFASKSREYAPISGSEFFEQAVEVDVQSSKLKTRVYYTPSQVPGSKGTVMICHHGAGYSGLSFACFSKEVTKLTDGECGVLSLDAREHGMYFFVL
jgi:hypothetical protein